MRGTAALGQNEDRFGGLGRRPSKLGPTGSVPASFMHVAGHTCSESRDMNTNIILSVSNQRPQSLCRGQDQDQNMFFFSGRPYLPRHALTVQCTLNRVKEFRHYFHIVLSLLAPKVLLDYRRPMIAIPSNHSSHPIRPTYSSV